MFVPEDDTCFLLFEAPSPEVVRTAVLHAELTPKDKARATDTGL